MAKRSKNKKTFGSGASRRITAPAVKAASTKALSSWFARDWFLGLLLILAVILVYQPVWWAGYIWDDDLVVTANPVIVGPLGLTEIWTTSAADICPLTLSTFWVEHALWGLAPLPYHLVNVLLQGAGAVALWRVLRSLQIPGAWLGAAIWALHPVGVESVAWIAEMKNTESGLFFLLSILFFVKAIKPVDVPGPNRAGWNYALTLVFAALAMACKSSTVVLPIVLCLCAWWMEGRWQWRNLLKVGPIFLMSMAASLLSIWTQAPQLAASAAGEAISVRTWPERLAGAGDAVWFYLGKLLWPYPLMTIYPHGRIDASQWVSYGPLLAVIIVSLILWLKRDSQLRAGFFCFAYFLVALIPVLGFVDNSIFRYSLVFDHFQYLASMGPLALAGAGFVRLANGVLPGRVGLQASLGAILLLVLGTLSWQRAWVYENEETLWIDAIAKNPDCWVGYNNLGALLSQRGLADEGILYCRKALEINPNYANAHNNLGLALVQKGKLDEAISEYHLAIASDPREADAHYNLGIALSQMGKLDEAMVEYRKALDINPNYTDAMKNLGDALSQKGQDDEEIEQIQKVLAIHPNDAEAYNNLGNALLKKGQVDDAISQFDKALAINPGYAFAHNGLGNALAQKGQLDEAMNQFQEALKIDPNYPQAHNGLGGVLTEKGQLNAAIDEFREALSLNPNYQNAEDNLAMVEAMARKKSGAK